MKKLTVILLFAVIFFIEGTPTHAANFDVTAGIVKLSGDTTYRIGYPFSDVSGTYEGYFPFSQLEFPLDVYMLSLGGSIEFSDRWKASLTIQTNITNDPGKMKDSDWGVPFEDPPGSGWWWWYGPKSLDIYSTSDTELDAMIWDINLGYTIYRAPKFSFIVGGGYLHQNFDFTASNLDQWYPSDPARPHDRVSGPAIAYEITYDIPYLEVGIQSNVNNKFSVGASLGYSPFVTIEDKDQHLLRNKVNRGDLEGDAFLFSVEARYNIFTNWFLMFGIDYVTIETDKGGMDASFNGIYDHTVTEEVESTQTSAMFTVGYAF